MTDRPTAVTRRVLMAPWFDDNPYQQLLADGLRQTGVEVIGQSADDFFVRAAFAGADAYHLHWLHSFYHSKRAIKRLLNVAAFSLQLLVARLRGKGIVWTVHNLRDHELKFPHLDRYCTWLVTRLATAVITHCDWSKAQLRSAFPSLPDERVWTIRHGHYIGRYPPAAVPRHEARARFGVSEDETLLLFFGNIRAYKGLPDLIDAFATLPPDAGCRLLIAGKPLDAADEGPLREAASGLAIELTLRSIGDDEIALFFTAADYLVLPYRSIATSGAAILGMSLATAIVAPDMGCLGETLREAGAILYDPADRDGLRRTLLEAVAQRPKADQLGQRNLEVARQWGWDRIAARTAEAYRAHRRPRPDGRD